jgi:2-dehydro-3-deoxyphosphogluconate aldolase/(4S)-4-hydroxy-2-oxoglutarate aldolase
MRGEILEGIGRCGIVPVIRLESAEQARGLGRALVAGGLLVAEVTFRSAAASGAIALLRKEYPELLVGAGTVLSVVQVEAALAAGASFAVTPGFNPRVVDACLASGLPVVPGINSPSQVEMALELGLDLLKFFPAEASGGVKMLASLHGPYPEISFVPTGGIDSSNLASYLTLPYVAAVGGSWMVREELIASGSWSEIERLSDEAVSLAEAARGRGRVSN